MRSDGALCRASGLDRVEAADSALFTGTSRPTQERTMSVVTPAGGDSAAAPFLARRAERPAATAAT